MVDIDPLQSRDIAASRQISVTEALALYHSNIAMDALAAGDTEQARQWQQAVRNYERALALSPGNSRLLSALGHSHEQLGETGITSGYLRRAIDAAPSRVDNAIYRMQLNAMQRDERSGT